MPDMGLPLAYGAGTAADELARLVKERLLIQEQQRRQAELEWQRQYQGGMLGIAQQRFGLEQNRDRREGTLFDTELPGVQADTRVKVETAPQRILGAGLDVQGKEQDLASGAVDLEDKRALFKARQENPDYYRAMGTPPILQKFYKFDSIGGQSPNQIDFGQDMELERERSKRARDVANIGATARIITDNPPVEKPSSGYERDALRFYQRGREAIEEMEALEPELQKMSGAGQAYQLFAPNILKSELGQRYLAAMKRYTEARLRKDSGAAVPPQEYVNDQKMASFVWGDKPETIAKKQASRRQIVDGLGFAAGRAYGEYYGSPFKPGQELAGTTGTVRMRAPTGEEFDADPEKVEFYEAKGATRVQQP